MNVAQKLSVIAALGLHGFVLWGWKPEPQGRVEFAGEPAGVEVELIETVLPEEETAPIESEPAQPPEPPTMEEPPAPEPPLPPLAESREEPAPRNEPRLEPKPQPKSVVTKPAKPAARPTASVARGAVAPGSRGGPSDGSERARWKHRMVPDYPAAAKRAGSRGSVTVYIAVNALGQPTSVRLSKSSGVPMLDEAALRAARASTFHPKKKLGLPVPDTLLVPYQFRLAR